MERCYSSDGKGEKKERKEAEQRIKESYTTENDEVKSQSKFQIIEYAGLEGIFSSLCKAQCL